MGRKPKLNAPQDVPAVEDEQDFFDEVLADFDDEEGVEIEGKIYRKTKPEDSIGRMSFEAIAKVCEKVDEDWIGRNFGSGNYFVKWTFRKGDRKELRQKNYSIGTEYDKFVKDKAPAVSGAVPAVSGLDLGGLLGSLTVEKIAAIGSAIKLVKDIFAPPPPPAPVDITKLLEIIATNSNKQSVSDAIVIESMRAMKQQNAQPPQTPPSPHFTPWLHSSTCAKVPLRFAASENERRNAAFVNFTRSLLSNTNTPCGIASSIFL
jgi:hypothetical protein